MAYALSDDLGQARSVVERLREVEDAPEYLLAELARMVDLLELERSESWQQILELGDPAEAKKSSGYGLILRHRAACKLGELEQAEALEEPLRQSLAKAEAQVANSKKIGGLIGTLKHMEGVRLASSGRLDEAALRLEEADQAFTYMGAGDGIFKLSNRLVLVEVLRTLGREVEAHRLLDQVLVVNPRMATDFQERGLESLGLSR
jgi:hypothetical protein